MYVSEINLEVRYYETDLMGIVHHSNYIRYFECGRDAALVKLGLPVKQVEEEIGVMMPVIKVECIYKTPAKYGDLLRIVSMVKQPPGAKIIVDTIIYNERKEVVCTGSVTLAFINRDTRRATRVPELLAHKFAPYFKDNNHNI
jgi:acyl-CoA thioester hydrolase